ncbi:unnamed protein product [Rotaria sordida]|uniref:Uncharacterized protein n=1 Tax=Rotaria sordida TaxID=392033 RepID=A0A815LI99_9BILA|nr:unnamed protein product [Rotaria sordida]CAF3651387.1 unnamed protein product [Rotaria sordida]
MKKQHPALLYNDEDSNFDNCDSSNNNSSVEITWTIDECENELERLSTYHQLKPEDNNDDDDNEEKEYNKKNMMIEKKIRDRIC